MFITMITISLKIYPHNGTNTISLGDTKTELMYQHRMELDTFKMKMYLNDLKEHSLTDLYPSFDSAFVAKDHPKTLIPET